MLWANAESQFDHAAEVQNLSIAVEYTVMALWFYGSMRGSVSGHGLGYLRLTKSAALQPFDSIRKVESLLMYKYNP